MDTILEKLRNLIEDNLELITESQEYYGGAKVFSLQYANIDESTLIVSKNGSPWADTNYSYSSTTGKVTVTGTLVAGDILEFQYSAYEKYSTNELRGYIRSGLGYLAIENYKTFTAKSDNVVFPTPDEKEEYLIAIIASILIKGSIRQYRTPEFTITFDSDNMSIEKKIRHVLNKFNQAYGYGTYVDLESESAESEEE